MPHDAAAPHSQRMLAVHIMSGHNVPPDVSWYWGLHRVASATAAALVAVAALALLPVFSSSDSQSRLSCAIGVTVAAIAAWHYYRIGCVRGSHCEDAQECVDALRCSEWAATLPLLGIEVFRLASRAAGDAPTHMKPIDSQFLAAVLLLASMATGAGFRFLKDLIVRVLMFCISMGLLVLVVASILNSTFNDTATPLTGDDDQMASQLFVFIWLVYPVVSVLAEMMHDSPANKAIFTDLSYAALDLVSKAGLVLYVVTRSV